jgi:hypothetical protein
MSDRRITVDVMAAEWVENYQAMGRRRFVVSEPVHKGCEGRH